MGTRIKNFDSTGTAPNGRLFAGDLNAMEDQYADQNNLGQTIGLSTLQIGEVGLQLLRYGASEARLSGAFRTDGILRALGGLYAGGFTTAQRDAIPAANRPTGLVILNTTTNRLEINLGTTTTPSWQALGGGGVAMGANSARPAAGVSNQNSFYFATDLNGGTLFYSDGSSWTKIAPGLTEQAVPIDNSVSTAKLVDNAVTTQKLDVTLQDGFMPVGAMLDFAGGVAPAGWVLCDGAAISRTTFSDLYGVIGTSYGIGDGTTTFNVPDSRGRVTVGLGTHADVNGLGENDGVTVANRRPKHRHTPHTHGTGDGAHPSFRIASYAGSNVGNDTGSGPSNTIPSNVTATGAADGGSGNPNDSLDAPAYIVVNKIIKT